MEMFEKIEDRIVDLVNNEIPLVRRDRYSAEAYFTKREKLRNKIINGSWLRFWEKASWLKIPTKSEIEELTNYRLMTYYHVVCVSLKELLECKLESSEQAKILHKWYLLMKQEINSRKNLPKMPKSDSFIIDLETRNKRQKLAKKLEKARVTGNICIHCGSTNVIGWGDKWKCKDCGRYFRKH